jgi:hypothetical protein
MESDWSWSNSTGAPIYWIKKHAPNIAVKLGEQIDKELGGGANGVAFLLKSGKVLKITGDDREVAAASRYRTKQNVPHIVSVYDVRKLEGDIVDPNDPALGPNLHNRIASANQHYVIIMDYVTPFDNHEQEVWTHISKKYLYPRFSDEITREELLSYLDENWYLRLPTNWVDKLITQRQSVLSAFRRNQVFALEAHSENMGWNRQGQLVHFDWWMVDQTSDYWNHVQDRPRRLNKSIKYDASGIDTPNDPTM